MVSGCRAATTTVQSSSSSRCSVKIIAAIESTPVTSAKSKTKSLQPSLRAADSSRANSSADREVKRPSAAITHVHSPSVRRETPPLR